MVIEFVGTLHYIKREASRRYAGRNVGRHSENKVVSVTFMEGPAKTFE